MGAVHLAVTDAARSRRYYQEVVGLRVLSEAADEVRLGSAGSALVVLHGGASGPVEERRTGLYHLALVVPGQRELAGVVRRLVARGVDNYPTDHVETKSVYFWDPDGNGIEIYAESPEDGRLTWDEERGFSAVDADGRLRSGRDPIDLGRLFSHLEADDALDDPLPAGARMGHVHLHVAAIDDALDFYHGILGFDVKGASRRHGVAFVSAGGYHHHLGLNTWAGRGAPPRSTSASGLIEFAVRLPDIRALEAVTERLARSGLTPTADQESFTRLDPDGNRVRLTATD